MPKSAGSRLLVPFGDTASYVFAPGGSFEAGAPGWSLKGSSVRSGNESYFVGSTRDSHSLYIPPTSNPVSAPICVDASTPTFRLFAKQASSKWAEMNINVLWTDASGASHVSSAGGLSATSHWTLSQVYDLGTMLPLWQPGSTLSVRLQFVPASGGGPVAVDDVLIDPYSR